VTLSILPSYISWIWPFVIIIISLNLKVFCKEKCLIDFRLV
jgi:hypothetical protein